MKEEAIAVATLPLYFRGVFSIIITELTGPATPQQNPNILLEIIKNKKLGAIDETTFVIKIKNAKVINIGFLPNLSAKNPETIDPKNTPPNIQDPNKLI